MGSGDFSLTGKRILVTGGGAGIGAAICRAASTAGAAVAVNDLDADRAAEIASRVGGFGVPGDVASEAGAAGVVEAAAAVLGGLDGLVNNAGIVTMGNLAGADLDEWRKVMDVNFQSVYLCSRAGRRHLADGGGSIVNLASIAAVHPNSGTAAYTASKAAVVALTRQAALEWGPGRDTGERDRSRDDLGYEHDIGRVRRVASTSRSRDAAASYRHPGGRCPRRRVLDVGCCSLRDGTAPDGRWRLERLAPELHSSAVGLTPTPRRIVRRRPRTVPAIDV